MPSNEKKRKAKRFHLILTILIILSIPVGLHFYYKYKSEVGLTKAHFENPDGSKSSTFFLEVADTSEERSLGLMYRKDLPKNHGMLFKFDRDSDHSFHMKNTYISLDLIFIDTENKVVGVLKNLPKLSTKNFTSGKRSRSAVELNAGTVSKESIKVGSVFKITENS